MSQSSSPDPIKPLTVGNAVTAGFRIYSSHLKPYFGLALRAFLWALLPVWVLAPLGLLAFLTLQPSPNSEILGLLVLVGILVGSGLLIYGLAKYWVFAAAISRLAYGELINQPESSQSACRYTHRRMWQFFQMSLVMGLIAIAAMLVVLLVAFVLVGVFAVIVNTVFGTSLNRLSGSDTVLAVLGGVLVFFVFTLLISIPLVWFFLRFFVVEIPLAIEEDATATSTISRSWELTTGNISRIFSISFVAFLITLPVQAVFQIFTSVFQVVFMAMTGGSSDPSRVALPSIILFLVLIALSVGINALVLPFWQIIKTVVYYDLRSRREGLDLQLRARRDTPRTEL